MNLRPGAEMGQHREALGRARPGPARRSHLPVAAVLIALLVVLFLASFFFIWRPTASGPAEKPPQAAPVAAVGASNRHRSGSSQSSTSSPVAKRWPGPVATRSWVSRPSTATR